MYRVTIGKKDRDYKHKKTALNKYNESTDPIKAVIYMDNEKNTLICWTKKYMEQKKAIQYAIKKLMEM